jgi:tetratricopeptide (TPR) repeat protein
LNRPQARLHLNHFEGALNDSLDVLKENPHDIKALYRSVKAHYGLENYDEALVQLKKLLTLEPDNKDGKRELNVIETRIKERRNGLYDFNEMIKEAKNSSNPRLNNASFVGPVQITEVSYTEKISCLVMKDCASLN